MTVSAREAVNQVLLSLGLDASDPIATQEQFAALRNVMELMADPEFQKDLAALRAWREAQEAVKKATLIAAIGAAVTATAAFVGWVLRSAVINWLAAHAGKSPHI